MRIYVTGIKHGGDIIDWNVRAKDAEEAAQLTFLHIANGSNDGSDYPPEILDDVYEILIRSVLQEPDGEGVYIYDQPEVLYIKIEDIPALLEMATAGWNLGQELPEKFRSAPLAEQETGLRYFTMAVPRSLENTEYMVAAETFERAADLYVQAFFDHKLIVDAEELAETGQLELAYVQSMPIGAGVLQDMDSEKLVVQLSDLPTWNEKIAAGWTPDAEEDDYTPQNC